MSKETKSLVAFGCVVAGATLIGLIVVGAGIAVTTHADKCSVLVETLRAEAKSGQFAAQAATLVASKNEGC